MPLLTIDIIDKVIKVPCRFCEDDSVYAISHRQDGLCIMTCKKSKCVAEAIENLA